MYCSTSSIWHKFENIFDYNIWYLKNIAMFIFLVHRQSVYMFCFQTINIEVGFWYLLPVTSCWIDSYLSFVYLFRNVSSSQKHKIHKWLKVNISFDIKKKINQLNLITYCKVYTPVLLEYWRILVNVRTVQPF